MERGAQKKLACFIISCSTDGLVSHCESWHNWVILLGMQHLTGLFYMLGSCVSHGGCSTTGLFYWACAAHNWVICHAGFVCLTRWLYSTTGLFHSSTQLGYFMQLTTGLFVMLGSSLAR